MSLGKAPSQNVDLAEFEAQTDAKAKAAAVNEDMDEEFYGSDSYNDDEFDIAGFDEMTFDQ